VKEQNTGEYDALVDEVDKLRAEREGLLNALHCISLGGFNLTTTREGLGQASARSPGEGKGVSMIYLWHYDTGWVGHEITDTTALRERGIYIVEGGHIWLRR